MVNLRIPRTATFAWSPGNHAPLLATGTVAGAVDADFSNATHLELWDLDLQSGNTDNAELTPKATVNTDSRFYDIAWGQASNDRPRGIIAGGLENGSLDLWSADALFKGEEDVLISQTTKHTGPIKALQFNPFKSELLLTAGVKGEIFVWDLNNTANPFLLGNRAQRADDFSSVDWNKKIPHILLSGGKNGLVTVWDVKQKKESLTLSHLGRKEVSAVAWHPENATKLLTAMPDDANPVVMVWDLRNANAPEKILSGHDQGVLSLAWCKQDDDILLSSGKDNRTICWNPNSGEMLGEFPIGTNWTFQTRFNPTNPDIMASASFDGKISIQSLQNKQPQKQTDSSVGNVDDQDFFNKASFDPQGPSFSLPQPPKWYRCPVGASFGFGGKLVSFTTPEAVTGQPRKSNVKITKYAVESEVSSSTESFENALKDGNLGTLCDTRINESKNEEEKEEWQVLKTLFNAKMKDKIVELLGFNTVNEEDDTVGELANLKLTGDASEGDGETQVNGISHEKRLSAFFADGSAESESFLSELASLPSTRGARTNNPFSIFSGDETDADKRITKALILGQFERAVDICIKEDRLSDAFMLAVCGGEKCVEKVQRAYFTKRSKGPNYLRVLASVVGKNLWDVVHNADLANWKEVMVALCTFADESEFHDLCEALGERLEEELKSSGKSELRKDAALCYLTGYKLEKVVGIWIDEYQETEQSSLQSASKETSSFAVHVRSLQQLIEKVTVFREATKFVDKDLSATGGWKLAPLYEKYCEYADVVAAHGHLDVAEKYLDLVPTQYPAAEAARNRVKEATGKSSSGARKSSTLPIAQNRPGTRSPMPRAQPSAPAVSANPYTPAASQTSMYGQSASQPGQYAPAAAPTSTYAPPTSQAGPYGGTAPPSMFNPSAPAPAPAAPNMMSRPPAQATNNYNPPSFTTPAFQQNLSQANTTGPYGFQQPVSSFTAPPPMASQSQLAPGPPPAATRKDIPSWNDTPLVEPRKKTPAIPQATTQITNPFPNSSVSMSPTSPMPPFGVPPRMGTPSAPPPKGTTIPRGMSPANVPGYGSQPPAPQNPYAPQTAPAAPSSNPYAPRAPAQNPYAPTGTIVTPAANYSQPATTNFAPPPAAPSGSSNRYAPQTVSTPMGGVQTGAPRAGQTFAPPPTQGKYAPPTNQMSQAPPSGAFGQAPPQFGAPPGSMAPVSSPPPPGSQGSTTAPPPKAPTPAPKYPAGDRSHIPDNARPIFELLSADMSRVAGIAPASFKRQVVDTEKRLNILFDHLNNEDLLSPQTVADMVELAQALHAKDYATAQAIQTDIHKARMDECTQWMVGVKRLVEMSRASS